VRLLCLRFLQGGQGSDDFVVRRLLGATMLGGGNGVRGPADDRADRNPDTNEFTSSVRRKECETAEMPLVRSRPVNERRSASRHELLLGESSTNPLERFGVS
jgi:hypothetical protein